MTANFSNMSKELKGLRYVHWLGFSEETKADYPAPNILIFIVVLREKFCVLFNFFLIPVSIGHDMGMSMRSESGPS